MDLLMLLKARPRLKTAIQMDVVSCSGPAGQIEKVESLVFDNRGGYFCHYDVFIQDNPDGSWGSIVDCTEEDYEAGLAWGLDAKTLGFEAPDENNHSASDEDDE